MLVNCRGRSTVVIAQLEALWLSARKRQYRPRLLGHLYTPRGSNEGNLIDLEVCIRIWLQRRFTDSSAGCRTWYLAPASPLQRR
jgi:hypothetical protein